jgi:hypothetical protein
MLYSKKRADEMKKQIKQAKQIVSFDEKNIKTDENPTIKYNKLSKAQIKGRELQDIELNTAINNQTKQEMARINLNNNILPPPLQEIPKDEIIQSVTYNETLLKNNLVKLGLTFQTATDVITHLSVDQILKTNTYWNHFQTEILKKFNARLLKPSFLIDYIKAELAKIQNDVTNTIATETKKQQVREKLAKNLQNDTTNNDLDNLENDEMPVTNFNDRIENNITNYKNFDEMFSSMLNETDKSDELNNNLKMKRADQIARKFAEESLYKRSKKGAFEALKENTNLEKFKKLALQRINNINNNIKKRKAILVMKNMSIILNTLNNTPTHMIEQRYLELGGNPNINDRAMMVNYLMKTPFFMHIIKSSVENDLKNNVVENINEDELFDEDEDEAFVNNILFNDPKLKIMYPFERKNDLAKFEAATEQKQSYDIFDDNNWEEIIFNNNKTGDIIDDPNNINNGPYTTKKETSNINFGGTKKKIDNIFKNNKQTLKIDNALKNKINNMLENKIIDVQEQKKIYGVLQKRNNRTMSQVFNTLKNNKDRDREKFSEQNTLSKNLLVNTLKKIHNEENEVVFLSEVKKKIDNGVKLNDEDEIRLEIIENKNIIEDENKKVFLDEIKNKIDNNIDLTSREEDLLDIIENTNSASEIHPTKIYIENELKNIENIKKVYEADAADKWDLEDEEKEKISNFPIIEDIKYTEENLKGKKPKELKNIYKQLTGKTADSQIKRQMITSDILRDQFVRFQGMSKEDINALYISFGGKEPKKGKYKTIDKIHFIASKNPSYGQIYGYGLNQKKNKLKVSSKKGLSHEPVDRFITFGKHVLHYPKLHEGIFNLRYASGANHKKFPISNISKDYKDFLIDLIDTESLNNKLFGLLPNLEQTHFKNLLHETGLSNHFKVKTNNESDEKNDHNRFVILQGELIAGNNNKKVIDEFKDLLNKFSQTGKLTTKQTKDALNVLNHISK